jgi:glycosyltransferase involved in cell wall biosynthesis
VQTQRQPTRILVIGYLPPPYFGPSVTFQALMRSVFARRFAVTFLNQSVVQRVGELEKLSAGKLFALGRLLLQELWLLLTRRFDFLLLSISTNRNAFLKEAAFIWLARLFGVRAVLYAHANGFTQFHDAASPRLQGFIARTVRAAAAGIVMGESLRETYDRWLPAEKIFVVGSGIEATPLPARSARMRPEFCVLFLANLIREKGVFTVLEAAPLVPGARFILAGDWKLEADRLAAQEFICRQGLTERVEFAGVVTGARKAQLLADADALVFPTHYPLEAHPLVLLEGMEAGLPVVTTARAAIPDIIRDGVNGLFVHEQDPADLAAQIRRLMTEPVLRERMSAANRERFAAAYTHERYGERMIDVFEALAAART